MEEKILDILAEVCEDDCVKDDMELELFEEGLLDSLGVAQLLTEVEEATGVVIAPTEITKEDIATPEKIIALIKEKM